MSGTRSLTTLSRGPADTAELGELLAPLLRKGDVLLLDGGLAVGKTYLVQCLVRALGYDDPVTSPTFALAHVYETRAAPFIHADAYRLSSVAEFRDLGLDDYLEESILAVEWGQIVRPDYPNHLSILIRESPQGETVRSITIASSSPRWLPVLQILADKLVRN